MNTTNTNKNQEQYNTNTKYKYIKRRAWWPTRVNDSWTWLTRYYEVHVTSVPGSLYEFPAKMDEQNAVKHSLRY